MVRNKKIRFLLMCISALVMLAMSAFAAPTAAVKFENDLIIQYKYEDTVISGAKFDAYLIAGADGEQWKLSDAFAKSGVGIDCENPKQWKDAALALKGYALLNGIAPDYTGSTDADGVLRFRTMRPGVYLVVGSRCTVGGYAYDATPFIAPMEDNVGTVTAFPKSEESKPGTEPIKIKVLKAWDDKGSEGTRPDSVTVTLLCDGAVYGTAQLSKENNWSYTWEGLDPNCEWSVSESVPEGYTYDITRAGNSFVITNTASAVTPTPTPTPTPYEPILPQTGQLWWPVPVLAAAGLLSLLIGLAKRKDGENE